MAYVENVKWIEQKFNESSEDKERNSALPSIQTVYKDDYFLSMQKMKNGFKYVYRKYGDQYDWYIKFDDDTYIVMENLRAFLLNKNSSKPQIHGFQLQNKNETEKESWVQGGSGFVMSNSAMKLLTEVGLDDPKYCRQDENVPEDIEIVYCLRRLNVTFGIGVDKHNKPHFSPFPAGEFAYPGDGNTRVSWLKEHSNYILNSDPISSLPIAFHYVSGSATYAMEYLLYKVNVMGRQSMLAHINYSQSELTNKINNYTSHNFV
uniref:N-acetylgalactosaminide beta-1,3-galactosyltransferase n=1 Tax=Rhabditophanes sp. KR3021 TaxID=114890 RepID=A0AC35UBT7_9BILA